VLTADVLDLLTENCDLVEDVCGKLAAEGRLYGYKHAGFWKPADTFKERAELEAGFLRGDSPWMLWEQGKAEPTLSESASGPR
jgi:glucose-1-phosphate cytidylyltransferase